jgi:hypothetical protein
MVWSVFILLFSSHDAICQQNISLSANRPGFKLQIPVINHWVISDTILILNSRFYVTDPAIKYGFKCMNLVEIQRLVRKNEAFRYIQYSKEDKNPAENLSKYIQLRHRKQLNYDLGIFSELLGYSKDLTAIILAIIHVVKYGLK